ncbi:MAG: hypothetical protein MJZ64_00295 [Paludibacteraceae bacterium]|nr:hypothetical protein [Paludibacteraceae bacterium]
MHNPIYYVGTKHLSPDWVRNDERSALLWFVCSISDTIPQQWQLNTPCHIEKYHIWFAPFILSAIVVRFSYRFGGYGVDFGLFMICRDGDSVIRVVILVVVVVQRPIR